MQVHGLYGHVQRNNFKAVALLGAFLALFMMMQAGLRIIPMLVDTTTYEDVERMQKRIERRNAAKLSSAGGVPSTVEKRVPSAADNYAATKPLATGAPTSASLAKTDTKQRSANERQQIYRAQRRMWHMAPFSLRLSTVLSATQFFDVQVKVLLLFALAYVAIATWMNSLFIRHALRARPLNRKELPELYSLVENLAINAGIPCPAIELINSRQLNAYASGLTPKQARLGLTTGLVQTLDRDELEAVIAHEMTHIVQGDSRLMAVTKACTDLVLLASIRRVLRKNKLVCCIIALSSVLTMGKIALLFVGLLGAAVTMFTYLTKALVLHAREFVADAGAIELTKNPAALISALRKISRDDLFSPNSLATQAMMFSGGSEGWFSTHPDVDDRIAAIERFGAVSGHDVLAHRRRNLQSVGLTSLAHPTPALAAPVARQAALSRSVTFGRHTARVLGNVGGSSFDSVGLGLHRHIPHLGGDLVAQAIPQSVRRGKKIVLPEGLATAVFADEANAEAKWYEKLVLSKSAVFLPTKIAIAFSVVLIFLATFVMPYD